MNDLLLKPLSKKNLSSSLALFAANFVLLGLPNQGRSELLDRTVALVNTEAVYESDFSDLKNRIKKPGAIDETLAFDLSVDKLRTDRSSQMEYLIREKLIDSEVKRLNLTATPERIDQEIRDLAKKNNITSEQVIKAIGEQGFTEVEYRAFLKSKIERQSLVMNEILGKIRVSDEDAMTEYYKVNPNAQRSFQEFSLSHIFFDPKKGGPEAAMERAQGVKKRLDDGEKFDSLTEKTSEDPNFSAGGFLGTFKTGEFLPEVEASVSQLNEGQVSGVIRSKIGFHIVRLNKKSFTSNPNFEKEKDRIKAQLFEKLVASQIRIWIANKKEEGYVKVNVKS